MKRIRCVMLTLGVSMLAGMPAWAVLEPAVETQIISYPVSSGNVNLFYNDFNPVLGQLIGVNITLDSHDTAQSEVISLSGAAGVAYSGASVSGGAETVSALGVSTQTTSLTAGPFAGVTTGFITPAGSGETQELIQSGMIASSDFSSFVGTGTMPFTVSIVPGSGTFSGNGPSSVVAFGGLLNSYGTVQIDYSYIPNVVALPEAPHFSFVAGGIASFLALGTVVRRTRRLTI